ncbi:hypothetical protein ACP3T3_13925 [Chryseobacterium sp. CBSDS_008]|uniref:hypothetical protein n=1 Tax=Chryseobacterium sp. CBSDS_008 TaxID=3415265 RepID=UPI003CEF2C7E
MNKKFILRLLLLVTVSLFFFNSCRTDEATQEEKRTEREKIEAFSRFESNLDSQKNTQKNSEYISYHKPFKEIIQTFMNNNPVFTQKFQNEVGDIYFNIRSVTYGETTKGIAYPIIKDGSVNAVLVGLVNPKRDWVNFIVLKNNSPEVQSIISNFQNVYNSPSIASRGGQPEQTEDILPVIINVYGDITGPVNHYYQPYVDYGSNGGGMSGGSETYGGAGGSQTQNPQDPKNPCEKSKNILSKADVQAKITELKNQSKIGSEIGVKIKADGTTSGTIPGGGHEVELGDTAGYQGGYHNHTPSGIKMLSPPDIVKMLDFSMAQPNGNIGDGFMGMFGSEKCSTCPDGYRYYNYMATFSGTTQELAGFLYNTKYDFVKLIKDYRDREKELSENLSYVDYLGADLNRKGLEKLFFDTLKKMGLEGKVNLQKIEDNGTVQNITLDSSGSSTTATPCP